MDESTVSQPRQAQEEESREAPPGAMGELARDPSSRKRFLKMVGGAGAAGAFSIFLAACGDDDEEEPAQTQDTQEKAGGRDLEIVNYALTLEYLEADFYQAVVDSDVKPPSQDLAKTFQLILQNEREHVDALLATAKQLGKPAAKPKTNFDSVIQGGADRVLQTAATVENLGAAAYLGQAGRIQSKEILAAALSIHTVEGRHAAELNRVVGKSIVPDGSFAKPAAMDEVLKSVQPFLAS